MRIFLDGACGEKRHLVSNRVVTDQAVAARPAMYHTRPSLRVTNSAANEEPDQTNSRETRGAASSGGRSDSDNDFD